MYNIIPMIYYTDREPTVHVIIMIVERSIAFKFVIPQIRFKLSISHNTRIHVCCHPNVLRGSV